MFMTDEMGEGSDVIPSPVCICGVAGPALVSTRLQNTRGACGGDVCGGKDTQGLPLEL